MTNNIEYQIIWLKGILIELSPLYCTFNGQVITIIRLPECRSTISVEKAGVSGLAAMELEQPLQKSYILKQFEIE